VSTRRAVARPDRDQIDRGELLKSWSEFYVLHTMVRVSQGIFGFHAEIFGLTLSFYLTIMVHRMKVALIAVQNTPGFLALALRALPNGYHSYQRGDTRSRALRFLQPSAVQNVELTLQKMSQAP
jgi:hypothetical protein